MKEEEKKAVLLPAELYERIEGRVRASEFSSVEEYVMYVMEEILREEESAEEPTFSEVEEEVKTRLRALG